MNQSLIALVSHFLPAPWPLAIAILIALATFVATLWRIFYFFGRYRSGKRAKRLNSKLLTATQVASFTDSEVADAIEYYVEPDCAQSDPANEAHIRQVASVRENVFEAVDRYLQTGGLNKHLLILADSGMGKTTFCLNYYAREQKKKEKFRHPLVVIPLGRADAVKQVEAIERKRDTVLFLDAFDEDTAAIQDSDAQLRRLMDASADFKNIVVTCRSQFFLNDGAIPTETGVAYVGPRRAGLASEFKFYKLYLLPFTDAQISQYLKSQFTLFQYSKRKRAKQMIAEIPELSVRPMLLALIPELIARDQSIAELWDLYTFMVNSWLERESKWILPASLLAVSKNIAVIMYVNRDKKHTEHISLMDLRALADSAAVAIEGAHLTARSLLNRDSAGNFKFAHRSIMEFLFVSALIDGDERCVSVEWTDLMRQLFFSWGRSESGSLAVHNAARIFASDLRATKLLPLASHVRPAQILENSEISTPSLGNTPSDAIMIPPVWRTNNVHIVRNSERIFVFDLTFDLTWTMAVEDTAWETTGEQGVPMSMNSISHMVAAKSSSPGATIEFSALKRLPSIDEFISLWEIEPAFPSKLLKRNEVYWLGDRWPDSSYLACSLGDQKNMHPLIKTIGGRVLNSGVRQEMFTIYSVAQRTWPEFHGQLYSALVCNVEVGGAEANWHCMTQAT